MKNLRLVKREGELTWIEMTGLVLSNYVARVFGLQFHVAGIPFGSSRNAIPRARRNSDSSKVK